ncbi:hypothetical protein I4U23_016028 [Adineta vaga]|nr:hypothetical protein I4U23_016028 [Adineta vaga]
MWQLEKDFYSLFQQQKYAPIDGMRSISCLMIISLHIITLLNAFIPSYPHIQWMIYLNSYSYRFSSLLSLALETFFMLSGFLLTLKFMKYGYSFSWKAYPLYILKRACRFWPGILLTTIVMLILGEPEGNWTSLWLFYQNYVSMEQWTAGFAALWSISLDMQMHILLPLILYIIINFKANCQRTYILLYTLVILSVAYSVLVFNPKTMNVPTLWYHYNSIALLMSPRIFNWIKIEYNVTMGFDKPLEPNPIKPYLEMMYFPISSRYSSFIIGSILAFNIINIKKTTIVPYGKIKKYIYFVLILLFITLLTIPAEPNTVNNITLTIILSIIRQIFSISQAFILFSAICPPTHPYHSSWIKSFLSFSIWTPIAKLSYLIYVLHFRIALELIMSYSHKFDPKRFSIDGLTLICLAIVLAISLIISTIWLIFIEKPFERLINKQLSSTEKSYTK